MNASIDIVSEADIIILEYRITKALKRSGLNLKPVPLVAKELATNILKYGGKGYVKFSIYSDKVELVAEDTGKRIEGLKDSLKTNLSRQRGLGLGLEVVKRQSDKLKIKTNEYGGITVKTVFWLNKNTEKGFGLEFGKVARPHYLEIFGGDVCLYKELNDRYLLIVADVLGHGKKANTVTEVIEQYIQNLKENRLDRIYLEMEKLISGSRGCAAFIALISRESFEYINVGNVRAWILFPQQVKRLIESPGVIGRMNIKAKVNKEPVLLPDCTLLVCTDGIKRGFSPAAMPWVRILSPQAVAERIIQNFSIKEDDASVLVVRRPR